MTRFLDVRLDPVGGILATSVAINQGTSINDYQSLSLSQLLTDIRGRHVLIGTHGYAINRLDGIACLSQWEDRLQLADPAVFVGLLWPGDSSWALGLDYPVEPEVANNSGLLIARFLNSNFQGAASISFASHSLGARVVLQTVANMNLPVRRLMLMAGAIDDNCLTTEFSGAVENTKTISALASRGDAVLSLLFPMGNFVGGIIAAGHPWWHAALGQCGPAQPWPENFQAPFEVPDNWEFGHLQYLWINPPPTAPIAIPIDVPVQGSPKPSGGADGWQEAFTAAFCSTRFS